MYIRRAYAQIMSVLFYIALRDPVPQHNSWYCISNVRPSLVSLCVVVIVDVAVAATDGTDIDVLHAGRKVWRPRGSAQEGHVVPRGNRGEEGRRGGHERGLSCCPMYVMLARVAACAWRVRACIQYYLTMYVCVCGNVSVFVRMRAAVRNVVLLQQILGMVETDVPLCQLAKVSLNQPHQGWFLEIFLS